MINVHCKKARKIVFQDGALSKKLVKERLEGMIGKKIKNQHIGDSLTLAMAFVNKPLLFTDYLLYGSIAT
jgi:hypothetical protein